MTTLIIATFVDGPLDGQPAASLDDLPPVDPVAPPQIVYVQHPFIPGAGVAHYGAALEALAAPLEGQPDQHVYELAGDLEPLDLATVRVLRRVHTDAVLAARYRYRGPFPKLDVPEADGPVYLGPCRVRCAHRCLVPPGITATELLLDDTHEPEAVAAAHGCHCGRLFATVPTDPPANPPAPS